MLGREFEDNFFVARACQIIKIIRMSILVMYGNIQGHAMSRVVTFSVFLSKMVLQVVLPV